MATEKQLEANRANARKSTGPRSLAGKARSRLNSRKHGLTANTLIIVGENAEDFDELRAALIDEHDPQSALECELVERLAGILWRLRRVPFFEAAILDACQAQASEWSATNQRRWRYSDEAPDHVEWSLHIGKALIHDGSYGDSLGKLARHEATLMGAFTKTLQTLLLLQNDRGSRRRDDAVMLEAVTLSANCVKEG